MMLIAIALLQGSSLGLPRGYRHDDELRFTFYPQAVRAEQVVDAPPQDRPTLFRIVKQCGGLNVGLEGWSADRVTVVSRATGRDLEVARCVRQATAVGFWVTAQRQGGYRGLWSGDLALSQGGGAPANPTG